MEEEIWKDIPNYEGLYQASNLGNIKSLNYKRTSKEGLLKPYLARDGYLVIGLCKNSKNTIRKIHQIVAIVFLNHQPCGYKLVVNHINFIKTDNRIENLEIVTARENSNRKHLISSSKYVGVYWRKRDSKWYASIAFNGSSKHLGIFDNEEEASECYNKALKAIENKEDIKTKPTNFTSHYKGVHWSKSSKKWQSKIKVNGKSLYLGSFIDEKEASEYYENALIAIEKGEEIQTKKKAPTSQYKGVHWDKKAKKWKSSIKIDNIMKYLGHFKTELEAFEACIKAKIIHK